MDGAGRGAHAVGSGNGRRNRACGEATATGGEVGRRREQSSLDAADEEFFSPNAKKKNDTKRMKRYVGAVLYLTAY